ncbi:hypothetical protein [Corallococcus exiguus]|uniref:Uncharacterized protein n=1 Tax=Corallococcus exiguus TaxID=83462 RepID=A0A7X5BRT6_9BACT|nr:hypothetical protein [Corallococcus exiguus]NBC41400.1 hypothetical protein [Corallococcus exiguus]TNV67108.1 hypothetical protein FH620_02450 [Corallococcus exiguus]
MKGILLAIGILASGAVALRANAEDKPATAAVKNGWWIKIKTEKTEASSISFQIGTSKKDRRDWRVWRSGDPVEFDVPDDFRTVSKLYIHATSNPNDKNSWFCMMYKGDGVKHLDFDDDEDQYKGQGDRDSECN